MTLRRRAPVAVFLRDLAGGGAERAALNLINELTSRGFPIDVVLVREEGPYLGLVDERARIVHLGGRKTVLSIPRLARYLRAERPVGLVAFQTHVNVAAVIAHRMAMVDMPVVVSEQVDPYRWSAEHPLPLVRAAFRVAPRVYRHATAVTAVSDGVADEWRHLMGSFVTRVHTVYNPVFRPQIVAAGAEVTGDPWLDCPDVPVVLAAGRLDPQKNYPMLLRAFALAVRETPCRLVILGEGTQEAALKELAGGLGVGSSVRFAGFQSNPYAFMSRAHVYALSSDYEGLPTVLIEALACGARIVTTDCPHGPREITEDGCWGTLVPVGDSEGFARALVDALNEPRPGAMQRVRAEVFGAGPVADRYLELLGIGGGPNG